MVAVVGLVWFMVMGTVFASLGLFVLPVSKTFHGTVKDVGFAASAFVLAMTILEPILGGLVDRFGAHRVMAVGVVFVAASCLVAASSSSIVGFSWAMAFAGAGTGAATYLPGTVVITSWFEDRRGAAMGALLILASMGAGLVPLFMAWLIRLVEWQGALRWVAGGLFCIVLPVVLLLIRAKQVTNAGHEAPVEDRVPTGLSVTETLRQPVVWMLVCLALLLGLNSGGLYLYIAPYLEQIGFSSTLAAGFLGLTGFSAMLGVVAYGWMADRVGYKPALITALAICALGAPLILLSGLHVQGLIAATLFGILWGSGLALSSQFAPLILIKTAGMRHFGLILGGIGTVSGLARAASPLLVGTIHDATGGYDVPFLLCAGLVAVTAIIVVVTKFPNNVQEANHA